MGYIPSKTQFKKAENLAINAKNKSMVVHIHKDFAAKGSLERKKTPPPLPIPGCSVPVVCGTHGEVTAVWE